jgi:sorbitol-6-phosphate 2-dehydrogenase
MSWLDLEGRVVIITGGACGLGRAMAQGFAEVGCSTVIADINMSEAQKTAEEIGEAYGGAHCAVDLDVTDRVRVDALVETVIGRFGKIDVLVNNAGILIPRLVVDPAGVEELSADILDKMLAINVKGYFLCTQAVARSMIKAGNGGVIINMASESGLEGSLGQSVYAATKAAEYSMTRSWAKELGKYGIRVAGVAPGIMEATALRSEEYERALAYTRGISIEQLRKTYEKISIPLGRPGRLSEVADVVCFLASKRASYIHGTVINISGGKSRA